THDIDEAIHLSDRIYIMNGVPGQITEEIIVDCRLKNSDYNLSDEFIKVKRRIMKAIEEKGVIMNIAEMIKNI
ncbi:MAG: hypothetical protein ACRDA4_05535, partial [Filifactoraceae bacterium]